MRLPVVLDASALVALFDAEPTAMAYFNLAAAGTRWLILPTAAIADAGQQLQAPAEAWAGILLEEFAEVAPLTESIATEVGSWQGSVTTRHVIYEAREYGSPVLTRTPEHYSPGRVPLLVF